ncbi:MAG: peptidase domain-containing ABC transporter [Bacteroidales bacterium]|nr:peptidase domain-containing ABC transporter [Candidatus Egerieousia equi]
MYFPHYTQSDMMDCGPTCLRIIAKHYGKLLSAELVRKECHISRGGVSMLGISDAAEKLGFHTIGAKLTWQQLRDTVPFPCIAHWNQNHFVVIYDIRKRYGKWFVYISDPASGRLKYFETDFLKSWIQIKSDDGSQDKGAVLLLEATSALYCNPEDKFAKKKFGLSNILQFLHPHRQSIVQIFLAMAVASVLSLILPFITQSVVDKGVSLGNLGFVKVMLAAQILIILGQLANDLIRNWLMLHTTARVSISLISDFLSKLMRLPIAFFDSRMTGDIMQRIQDHSRIQEFLTGSLLSIVMAIVLLIVYGAILGGYSLTILAIFLVGSALYVGWVLAFLKWRRKLDYMRFQEAANNQSSIVQLIGGMQEIKLNNCERQKRWEWERIQTKLFRISIKGLSLSQAQQIGGTFLDQTKNIIISYLAARAVIDGNMTLGMMTALSYIIGQLNAPVSQFITFARDWQDANISMERLGEIHNRDDEEPSGSERIHDIPDDADLEFSGVTFQYEGPHSPKVLDNVSLRVPHGKVTAIVGASGSGKTTMLKMMLGFYEPVEGKVTLGGTEMKAYSESAWRRRCGCVMQEGYIFSNTIAQNIALCDETPDMERVRLAAAMACIDGWVNELPLRYNTKIGADGHGLSTGQKQRLLIARAAYRNTPYLFFDEATNSLDANNERAIMENLDRLFRNKTVVVIAHRLSTVRNADNIVVLDHGNIVEQGTHEELTARRGYYYELVRNQLELGN